MVSKSDSRERVSSTRSLLESRFSLFNGRKKIHERTRKKERKYQQEEKRVESKQEKAFENEVIRLLMMIFLFFSLIASPARPTKRINP